MAGDDEQVALRSAWILGESSASYKALAELKRRREEGEIVGIFLCANTWIVGPYPKEAADGR